MEEVAQESEHVGTNSKLKTNQDRVIAGQELQGIQISNRMQNQGGVRTSPAASDYSATRTRTMCCSHNGCSDDSIHTKKKQIQQANAFNEKAVITQGNEEALSKEDGQNDKGISDISSSLGPPPGFEIPASSSKVVPNNKERTDSPIQSVNSIEQLAKDKLKIY